jgi:hypothetical protein
MGEKMGLLKRYLEANGYFEKTKKQQKAFLEYVNGDAEDTAVEV